MLNVPGTLHCAAVGLSCIELHIDAETLQLFKCGTEHPVLLWTLSILLTECRLL